jgi:SAM-dependent methyltransferase
MKDTRAADWEELARREPYFPVLTNEGLPGVESNRVATTEFFETGEADISGLLEAITSLLGREIRPAWTLDFGCGVGRITVPLARRSIRVVGCDVAPTMLVHAQQNVEKAELQNVTLILTDELATLPAHQFDLVCSLLVFQYIPPPIGYPLIRAILSLLAHGGVAALHITFGRRDLGRYARWVRERSHPARGAIGVRQLETNPLAYTERNAYDERRIIRDIHASGARLAGRFAMQHGEAASAVLIIEKMADSAATV